MRRETRIRILNKLAKKDRRLSGRKKRKEVERHLADSKKAYDKAHSELKGVESMIMKLKEKYEALKDQETSSRDDMSFCHQLLRNMDFAKADEVKIRDKDDVAYSVDGKWCSYSDDEGVKKYERKKKEENLNPQGDDPDPDKDKADVNDTDDDDNDINDVINKLVEVEETKDVPEEELMEGVDITR